MKVKQPIDWDLTIQIISWITIAGLLVAIHFAPNDPEARPAAAAAEQIK